MLDSIRPPGSRPLALRIAIIAIVVAVSFTMLRTIVRHSLSEAFFADANLPTAFVIDPHNGIAAGYLAWTLQRTQHRDIAVRIARDAISETTLSAPAMGTLALAGPTPDRRLIGFAAASGWRDPVLQQWLGRQAIERGDMTRAAQHLDAAARIDGVTAPIRALIDRMTTTPFGLAAMARRVALVPQWRVFYLMDMTPPIGSIAARGRLLAALDGTAAPPDPDEIKALVVQTNAVASLPEGYELWRRLVPRRTENLVFDPDFEQVIEDPQDYFPFAWRLSAPPGLSTESVRDGGGALHVTSDGTAAGGIAQQLTRITPGRHRLTVGARYAAPGAATAFRWSVGCLGANHAFAALTASAGATTTGSADFAFDVPSDGSCPILAVSLLAQPAERPGQAEAWFNDVRIT